MSRLVEKVFHSNGKTTFLPSEKVREIALLQIASNVSNPRNPAAIFAAQGYGLFSNPEGSKEENTLYQLATSGEPEKMAEFVRLVEKYDVLALDEKESEDEGYGKRHARKTIVQLANSIAKRGTMQPIRVRPITKGALEGCYDIIYGARRFMANLYLACKNKDIQNAVIPAFVTDDSDKKAEDIALDENITADPLTKMEVILAMRQHKERGKSEEWIANVYSTNVRTVKRRLNASYAPANILQRLVKGTVGITDVETIGQKIKAGRDPEKVVSKVLSRASRRGNPTSGRPELPPVAERKGISRRMAQELYETGTYPNGEKLEGYHRQFLSQFFGFAWKTVAQIANEKAAEDTAKVAKPVQEVRRGRGRPKGSKNKPKIEVVK